MSDRHVLPADDGWHVEKDNAQRASAKTVTQLEAIKRAVEIVAHDGGGQVFVHGSDGQVRETRTVAANAENTTAKTAAATTSAGANTTAKSATNGLASTASKITDDVTATGEKIVDGARGGARGAANTIDDTAERAGDSLARGADRAAKVGAQIDDELETAAHRGARRVHSVTERVARPIDATTERVLDRIGRFSQALNPIRVTGRTIEIGVSVTLYATGAITSRGTRTTQRAARNLTSQRR